MIVIFQPRAGTWDNPNILWPAAGQYYTHRVLGARHLNLFEHLDDIAHLNIRVRQHHTAFVTCRNLGHIVLFSAQ